MRKTDPLFFQYQQVKNTPRAHGACAFILEFSIVVYKNDVIEYRAKRVWIGSDSSWTPCTFSS
jgi:hypothetical protein